MDRPHEAAVPSSLRQGAIENAHLDLAVTEQSAPYHTMTSFLSTGNTLATFASR